MQTILQCSTHSKVGTSMGYNRAPRLGVWGSGYISQGTIAPRLAMFGLDGLIRRAGGGGRGMTALGDSSSAVDMVGDPRTGDGGERKGVDGATTGMTLRIAVCISAASATADDVSLSTTPLPTSQ